MKYTNRRAMCLKKVTNKNLTKDGYYFCNNKCEAEFWRNDRILIKTKVGRRTIVKVLCDLCANDFFEFLKKKNQRFLCDDCKERIRKIDEEIKRGEK